MSNARLHCVQNTFTFYTFTASKPHCLLCFFLSDFRCQPLWRSRPTAGILPRRMCTRIVGWALLMPTVCISRDSVHYIITLVLQNSWTIMKIFGKEYDYIMHYSNVKWWICIRKQYLLQLFTLICYKYKLWHIPIRPYCASLCIKFPEIQKATS